MGGDWGSEARWLNRDQQVLATRGRGRLPAATYYVLHCATHGSACQGPRAPNPVSDLNPAPDLTSIRCAQSEYKVLLLVDGNAWASAWEWALASGCVIVWVGVWSLHLMEDLLPNVHYLPAKPDLSDLEEQVLWVLSHDVEGQVMAQNAASLFQRVATPAYTRRALARTLVRAHCA